MKAQKRGNAKDARCKTEYTEFSMTMNKKIRSYNGRKGQSATKRLILSVQKIERYGQLIKIKIEI